VRVRKLKPAQDSTPSAKCDTCEKTFLSIDMTPSLYFILNFIDTLTNIDFFIDDHDLCGHFIQTDEKSMALLIFNNKLTKL